MSELDKLHDLCKKTYKEQAVWFLNCFWEDFAEKEAELLWQYVLKNAELDLENHEEGCGLDEMKAHVFLEKFDETLTVREMRAKLRSTGAIGEAERPKSVPLTHYLLYKYNVDWHTLVDEKRQGDNQEEMEKAEAMLQEVLAAFRESEAKASEARNALNAAVSAENSAKAREDEAVASENAAVARENEAVESEKQAVAREAEAVESEKQAVESENAAVARENEAVESENQAKAAEAKAVQQEADAKESEAQAVAREAEAVNQEAEAVQREVEAKASEAEAKQREAAAKETHAQSQEKESIAKKDADAAIEKDNEAKSAQEELEAALAALKAEEDAYNQKKAELEKKITRRWCCFKK